MANKTTYIDMHLGRIYFQQLLDLARTVPGGTVRYKTLVETAQHEHPDDPIVQSAIATNIGRRLDPVNEFCRMHNLPDLACLAVGADGEPGDRYKQDHHNWREELQRVHEFDWSKWTGQWNAFAEQKIKTASPKFKRREPEADVMFYEHWSPNRATLPPISPENRARIIKLLMAGFDAEEAFSEILELDNTELNKTVKD